MPNQCETWFAQASISNRLHKSYLFQRLKKKYKLFECISKFQSYPIACDTNFRMSIECFITRERNELLTINWLILENGMWALK